MSVEDLFEYARMHPDLCRAESKFDALNRIKSLYSELSEGIHGRRVADLEMRTALEKIVYEEQAATKHVSLVERCAEASNFLLSIYQRNRFAAFDLEDRRIILGTMTARARNIWSEIDS
jgi:hypothetical protein